MISLPIWLFVLFCIFGFIGVCAFVLFIYGIIISIVAPMKYEGDLGYEDDTTSN